MGMSRDVPTNHERTILRNPISDYEDLVGKARSGLMKPLRAEYSNGVTNKT